MEKEPFPANSQTKQDKSTTSPLAAVWTNWGLGGTEWEEDTSGRTPAAVPAFAARRGSGKAGDSKWAWVFGNWSQWDLLVDGCGVWEREGSVPVVVRQVIISMCSLCH